MWTSDRYKVCVYAISKNEAQFVDRWMDSVGEADLVVVLDTGSTDGTADRLRARGAIVYEETIKPWRFDEARNRALGHVPPDADICVSNDLDEVFEPGWRAKLEAAWQREHTRAKYLFTWSYRADGTPDKQYPMEKIHRRQGFRWVRPVHEVLAYDGPDKDISVWVPGLVLHHHPDLTKPRAQYLPLLELAVLEDPEDDRVMFWLGREYMYHKQWEQCIETLKRHLDLPAARWDEERSASMRYIALCYDALGDADAAKRWLLQAVGECPHIREPYLALAKLGYRQQDWPLSYAMAHKGLSILQSTGSYLVDPESWGAALYDYGAIAAYRLGLHPQALEYARQACALDQTDERLRKNLALIEGEGP